MGIAILVAVLLVVIFIALRSTVKHMRGQGGCCGGSNDAVKTEEKILDVPVIMKKIVMIEGMHCVNCETSVMRAFNRMDGVAAKACHKEGKATLSLAREITDTEIRLTIGNLGFTVKDIQTKML
ncbi:MAG: heavy-metal-associated domain-containing protein [Clostridia bacterium]|nr:heavy-metal-associated domain-containing protein [Clostridia bacterium]